MVLRRNLIDLMNPPLLNFLRYSSHKNHASVHSTPKFFLEEFKEYLGTYLYLRTPDIVCRNVPGPPW